MTNMVKDVSNEIVGWIGMAITIVIGSIVLVKFKNVNGVTAGLNTTIDNFVSAIAEPENWVAIVIIAVIGIAILGMFLKLFNKKGK